MLVHVGFGQVDFHLGKSNYQVTRPDGQVGVNFSVIHRVWAVISLARSENLAGPSILICNSLHFLIVF